MKGLDKELKKIAQFANTQRLKKEEYFNHNLIIGFRLFSLLAVHVFLSIIVLYISFLPATILIILNGYIVYYYLVLTVHEGSHDMLFFSKNKKTSLMIRRLLPTFPTLIGFPTFTVYLRDHMLHHKYLSEKEDPQNSSKLNFRKIPLFYFLRKRPKYPLKHFIDNTNLFIFIPAFFLKIAHIVLLYALGGVIGIIIGLGIPLLIASGFNALRISFRHYNLYPNPKPLRSRSYTFFGSSILGPLGLKYHFEHHLFCYIPSYRLKKIYDFVEDNCPEKLINKIHYKHFKLRDFW